MKTLLADGVETEQTFIFISYVAEMENLLLVSEEGLILSLCLLRISCVALSKDEEIQPVGDIEGGILNCAWSYDQEMLLIVTKSGSLVLLNNSFEVLNEAQLEDLHPDSTPFSVLLSWRSDGENVSISYLQASGARCIRVLTKELEPFSISSLPSLPLTPSRNVNGTECCGLQRALSWNPDHSLIATVQEERGRTQVSFLEKNGLRHGEFALGALQHGAVAYNSAGDILAVTGELEGESVLQLWTRNNYHWYKKLERRYAVPVVAALWDLVDEARLSVLHEVPVAP